MSKQRGLGKGLGAFFNPSPAMTKGERQQEIETSRLRANPYQPRKDFDEEKLSELTASIGLHGIIQPLIARPIGDDYEIVAGERRWRAAQRLTLATVPVVVRDYTDEQVMQITLIENIQRHDLNPIEEAQALKNLMDALDITQEDIANRVGRSRSAVANSLRLLNLPDRVKQLLSAGQLTMGQARPLLALQDEKKQALFADKIVAASMSAREVETLVKSLSGKKDKSRRSPLTPDTHLAHVQDDLALLFGTHVEIKKTGGHGKILIDFYSDDDLERLLELFHHARPDGGKRDALGTFTV